MLSTHTIGAIPVEKAYFGPGEVHIFLDEVACIGNETSLLQCPGTDAGLHNCYHTEDAGVVCPGWFTYMCLLSLERSCP